MLTQRKIKRSSFLRAQVLEGTESGLDPGQGLHAGLGDHARQWQYNKIRILTGRAAGIVGYAAAK